MKNLFLTLLMCAGLASAGMAESLAAERISPEVFADEGQFFDVKLSPDGKHLAATVPQGDRSALIILQRSPQKLTASYRMPKDTHIADFWWANEERVLIALAESFGSRDYLVSTSKCNTRIGIGCWDGKAV